MTYLRSIGILALVFTSTVLPAQGISRTVAENGVQAPAVVGTGLHARISINLNNVPFAQALETVARQAAVKIVIANSARINKLVTLRAQDISADQAFRSVLEGTNVRMTIATDGQVLFAISRGRGMPAQGSIMGKVTDAKTSKAVSGATVSIGNDTRGVVSGDDGSYRLTGVSAGTHTVTVRLVGYAKQSRQVTVGEAASITADFKLEPSANVLNEVVVTGTVVSTELKAVPSAITVITAKQIEERGITRIDQLFRGDIPGLFSLNVGSVSALDEVSMFSRGATALTVPSPGTPVIGSAGTDSLTRGITNAIKTFIDGVEMTESKYLSQIDPASIERIEILTGPQASTIYGSGAINGVMQIFTKRGSGSTPQLNLNISSGVAQNNFNSNLAPAYITDARASAVEGKVSYNVGGSWNYTGPWTPGKRTQRLGANGGVRMEWSTVTGDLSARYSLTQNRQSGNPTQSNTNFYATGFRLPSLSPTVGNPFIETQALNGNTLGLSMSYRPYSWWSHDVGLGSDSYTAENVRNNARFTNVRDTLPSIILATGSQASQRYTTTLQFPVSSFAGLNLVLGGEHWRTNGTNFSPVEPTNIKGAFNCPFEFSCTINRIRPAKNSGAYAQGQLSIKDALFFTYGIRRDWNPNLGEDAKAKPGRYGVSYAREFGPISAKLRGSYGRSIKPPNDGQRVGNLPTDLFDINGVLIFENLQGQLPNSDLGPEFQQGGEGGVELYFSNRGSIVVTRYNQTVDNLITLVGKFQNSLVDGGNGVDSIRSLVPIPDGSFDCSSAFRDDEGHCYKYQVQYINVGSIRNQGWEFQGSLNLGPLTTRGTYTWSKSRVLGITPRYRSLLAGVGYEGFQPGLPFNFIPEHTWALGMTYTQSKSSVSLSVNGVGMRYVDGNELNLLASNQTRIHYNRPIFRTLSSSLYRPIGSGYAMTDLNASHRFSSSIDAILQVNNLANYYANDYDAAYASIGRQTRVGLRMRLR